MHTARNLGLMPSERACGGGKRERQLELRSRKGLQTRWLFKLVIASFLPSRDPGLQCQHDVSQLHNCKWAE